MYEKLLRDLLDKHKGIALGECHFSRASLKFLIDSATLLQALGVTHIFTEKFEIESDPQSITFHDDTDRNRRLGNYPHRADEALNKYLALEYPKEFKEKYSMHGFVSTMSKLKISIVGIDTGLTNREICDAPGLVGQKARSKRAQEFIEHSLPKICSLRVGKFIVLTGMAHAGDFIDYSGKTILGIGNQLAIPSIGIIEKNFRAFLSFAEYQCFNEGGNNNIAFRNIVYAESSKSLQAAEQKSLFGLEIIKLNYALYFPVVSSSIYLQKVGHYVFLQSQLKREQVQVAEKRREILVGHYTIEAARKAGGAALVNLYAQLRAYVTIEADKNLFLLNESVEGSPAAIDTGRNANMGLSIREGEVSSALLSSHGQASSSSLSQVRRNSICPLCRGSRPDNGIRLS